MSTDRFIVHDRTGVKGQYVPVEEDSFLDIPEEYYEDLEIIQEHAVELESSRNELGRLMQLVSHLTNVCNRADTNLANAKQGIIKGMELGEGNWAIDFERKKVGKVSPVVQKMPRVV